MPALRLVEITLPADAADRFLRASEGVEPVKVWRQEAGEGEVVFRLLIHADRAENVVEALTRLGLDERAFRAMLVEVLGTVPELKEKQEEAPCLRKSGRVSREELLTDLAAGLRVTPLYLVMVMLSAVVAAVGLIRDDVAVIIGAMVIAPLLTPNVALAMATTLGDLSMIRRTLLTNVSGIAAAFGLAVAIGAVYQVDPRLDQIERRTVAGLGDIVLALAAGAAGAVSMTTGVPAALVGVMVAVAMLPPLVACGLLLGQGQISLAIGAATLTAINIICVNLAGVVAFFVQGIRPRMFGKSESARRSTWIAITLWTALLAVLTLVVGFARQRWDHFHAP